MTITKMLKQLKELQEKIGNKVLYEVYDDFLDAFNELKLHKIYLKLFPDDVKTIEIYESLGFEKEGILRKDVCVDFFKYFLYAVCKTIVHKIIYRHMTWRGLLVQQIHKPYICLAQLFYFPC